MNPNTIKTQLDGQKARQQYINALRVQASNNQLNANANMILKQTGATPTQPVDFRTTTERYADLESKRILLEKQLKSITDGTSASVIAHQLTPQEVEFAVGAMPYIQRELSMKYALGVPAPVAVAYIRTLKDKEELTNGVDFGLQQATGRDILLSNMDILNNMPSDQQLNEVISLLRELKAPMARRVVEDLENIRKMTPNEKRLADIEKLPPDRSQEVYEVLDEVLGNIPTKQSIDEIQTRLEKVRGDPRAMQGELADIQVELHQKLEEVKRVEDLYDQVGEAVAVEAKVMPIEVQTEPVPGGGRRGASEDIADWKRAPYGGPTMPQKREIIQRKLDENTELQGMQIPTETTPSFRLGINSLGKIKNHDDLNTIYEAIMGRLGSMKAPQQEQEPAPEGEPLVGVGMRGRGLKPRIRRDRIAHLTEGVVEKPKPYIPFGRYVIHRYDLDNGKLNIKTPKGGSIKELPSQKISLNLGKILQSIGKGVLPDYDRVNALKDEDKEVLHRVIHHSRMTDKVSVPTPKSKTEEEEISDRFDILKGEIMAGNDNPKIVKELKTLLMKLISTGRIPRKEAI